MLYFLIILTVLVLVHELGHFIVSIFFKVKVEEFGIGFPPAFFKKKGKLTTYSLNLLPLGGFVKLYGEDGSNQGDPNSFASKKLWQKIIILLAGVFNNLLLGYVILSILLLIGLPLIGNFDEIYAYLDKNAVIKKEEISITYISKDSPAISAGLKINDKIIDYGTSVGDLNKVNKLSNFEYFVQNNKGREVYLKVENKGKEEVVNVMPRSTYAKGDGPIGIALSPAVYYTFPFGQNFVQAFKMIQKTYQMFFNTIGGVFGSIFNLKAKNHDVAGPVGIAVVTSNVAKMGMAYLVAFTASFSINLAIVNMLPIPGLDGGRILMLLIEKISKKKFSQKFENWSIGIGLAFLIVIVIFVTIKDVLYYFIY